MDTVKEDAVTSLRTIAEFAKNRASGELIRDGDSGPSGLTNWTSAQRTQYKALCQEQLEERSRHLTPEGPLAPASFRCVRLQSALREDCSDAPGWLASSTYSYQHFQFTARTPGNPGHPKSCEAFTFTSTYCVCYNVSGSFSNLCF